MGGYGSGPPSRWGGTVEGSRSIDVLRWARAGLLVKGSSGSCRWTDDAGHDVASIGCSVSTFRGGLAVFLMYAVNGEQVTYPVPLEGTACRYGGHRSWFRCPVARCQRRCRFLYQSGKVFACRKCAMLTYASRRCHRDGATESNMIEQRLEDLEARWSRARSERTRTRLADRIARLEARHEAIWMDVLGVLGRMMKRGR